METSQNKRAKRYALEICQWLDGILKDESVDESIEYEMNNTVEGLSRQLLEVKRRNEDYKRELEELNSKYLEMSEYLSVKTKLQEVVREYGEYRSEVEGRLYQMEKRNEELQEEKTRLELRGRSLEEASKEVLSRNEELIRTIEEKSRELDSKVCERIEMEQDYMRKESEYKAMLGRHGVEKSEFEAKYRRLEESLRTQERELRGGFARELGEKELRIQTLSEECLHNKYRITELEKLLKMAENEQLVSKNYRSLIEQYKSRLLILESSERSYLELQERWSNQERLVKQQAQKLEQAEGWLKRMVELEQENSTLSQQIKQWETMAFRYTHNLKVLNRESTGGQVRDESEDLERASQDGDGGMGFVGSEQGEADTGLDSEERKKAISPTSVLSAIFEFQRRYQDVLVSKTVIETSKLELENKVDMLESRLQVCQREIKYYQDELNSRSEEIQRAMEGRKLLECEIKVLKECLSKESKSALGGEEGVGLAAEASGGTVRGGDAGVGSDVVEAQRKDLEEKMKVITHLESELKLRNEEIKTYWSIRVAYDTLTQERDSLLESSNSLQEHNKELRSQLASLNERIKKYEISSQVPDRDSSKGFGGLSPEQAEEFADAGGYSLLRDKLQEEQRRSQTLSEYYIKERNNLVDAISNILGWRIEIIYVEGGLTAYKLSNIFSNHGGELIFVIRPAPALALADGGSTGFGGAGNLSSAVTTTFLLSSENNVVSETEMEEQLTLDFIGYYANKFEEDSNWALQLTATQSYPAFMAYTCLEEFHSSNFESGVDEVGNLQSDPIPKESVETTLSEQEMENKQHRESVQTRTNLNQPDFVSVPTISIPVSDDTGMGLFKTKRLREDTSWIHPRE